MMTTSTGEGFQIMDPDLPFIAASAAVEVDDLMQGRNGSLDNVTRLAKLLRNAVTHEGPTEAPIKSLMDPLTTDVFSRAFSVSHRHALQSLEELARKADELSEELSGIRSKEAVLEVLRDFCVALSKYALATRHTLHQSRTRNPHKKIGHQWSL